MMCEFHDSNGNGFGDIWWTDKLHYFSSIDNSVVYLQKQTMNWDFDSRRKVAFFLVSLKNHFYVMSSIH